MLTPFGTIEYDDEDAIKHWMMAHDYRHRTYKKAMSRKGLPLSSPIMGGEPNADWFARHWIAHMALQRGLAVTQGATHYTTPSASQPLTDNWDSAERFYDWHQWHNRLHYRLDQQLQIVTTSG